jgi:hypothetical protein
LSEHDNPADVMAVAEVDMSAPHPAYNNARVDLAARTNRDRPKPGDRP